MINDNIIYLLFIFTFALFAQFLLIRRYVNNIADPMIYFIVISAFSLALASLVIDDIQLLLRINFYFVCLYLGFRVANGALKISATPVKMSSNIHHFKSVVIVCCLIYLSANILIWMNSGIILFSDDPNLQKSDAYSDGFGFIRRVNWGIGSFSLIATVYWWLWERSRLSKFFLALVVAISFTGGGKSALLPVISAFGLFFLKPFFSSKLSNKISNRGKVLTFSLGAALIPVIIILITQESSIGSAAEAFLLRLFYFGDILLYWTQDDLRAHFSTFSPMSYFRETFGSFLGMFRLIDYSSPIGNQLVQFSLPAGSIFSESLGPNLNFYVRGELYLGAWLAPFHAALIGWLFGYFRRIFVLYRGDSLLTYSLLSFAVVLSTSLPIDEGLVVGQALDFLLLFVPTNILILLLRGKKIIILAHFHSMRNAGIINFNK